MNETPSSGRKLTALSISESLALLELQETTGAAPVGPVGFSVDLCIRT